MTIRCSREQPRWRRGKSARIDETAQIPLHKARKVRKVHASRLRVLVDDIELGVVEVEACLNGVAAADPAEVAGATEIVLENSGIGEVRSTGRERIEVAVAIHHGYLRQLTLTADDDPH